MKVSSLSSQFPGLSFEQDINDGIVVFAEFGTIRGQELCFSPDFAAAINTLLEDSLLYTALKNKATKRERELEEKIGVLESKIEDLQRLAKERNE
jgi:hypothetical protein